MSTPISRASRRTCGAAGTGSRCSVPATLPNCAGMLNCGRRLAAADREAAPVLRSFPRRASPAWNARRAPAAPKRAPPVRSREALQRPQRPPPFQRENHLANFNLLAFFHFDVLHHSGDRRGNLDDSFVGFQFHYRLAFGNLRARRNHQAHQIALRDVLAEFGKLEFAGSRMALRRGGALRRGALLRRRAGAGCSWLAAQRFVRWLGWPEQLGLRCRGRGFGLRAVRP